MGTHGRDCHRAGALRCADDGGFVLHDGAGPEARRLPGRRARASVLGADGNHHWHLHWHGVIIGGSGLAYQHGWAGCAYPIGLGARHTAHRAYSSPKMRRYKFMTLSEEIACYYEGNRVVVEFSNITLFLSQLCWLTVQIMGGAAVLGAVTGLQPEAVRGAGRLRQGRDFHSRRIEGRGLYRCAANGHSVLRLWLSHAFRVEGESAGWTVCARPCRRIILRFWGWRPSAAGTWSV